MGAPNCYTTARVETRAEVKIKTTKRQKNTPHVGVGASAFYYDYE
jgi:hypothetical protein